ncbi:polysaccharide biosynthesis/export family protein [Aestuariibius sp. 2305UL40-4]|uniref:polysaccharide biosynthesis/export family protein n=1 Tax=Aestuariibius violaceus TaxID=3234132 RepID=UPI00398F0D33
MEREIVRGANKDTADFAVYPVTRAYLPIIASWPFDDGLRHNWPSAGGGSLNQVIRPGDQVFVTVWDNNENSLLTAPGMKVVELANIRVSPGGTIFLPYINTVQVAGRTPEAARNLVERRMVEVLPSAQVQLRIEQGRASTANLVTGVSAPGTYPLPDENVSILNLIAFGGGVAPGLRNPQVRLLRGSERFETSVENLFESPRLDVRVRGGDRVLVVEDDRYFLTLGAAGAQTQIFFTQTSISALDAVSLMGGIQAARGDPQGVLVLREYGPGAIGPSGPTKQRVVFTIDLTETDGLFSARRFRIQPGDVVLATESPITTTSTIIGLIGSGFGLAGQAQRFQ